MKEKLWKEYRQWKKIKLEICQKEKERLGTKVDDAALRVEIDLVESWRKELTGMLRMMWGLKAITDREMAAEEKTLDELFSPERMFGAYVKTSTGELIRLEEKRG